MHANLRLLPVEIVQHLASHLERPELYCLRLVCRDLYKKSLTIFVKLLECVKTDLSSQSLQKLLKLSSSTHLATHVNTLSFQADSEGALGRGFNWSRDTSGGLVDPFAGASGTLREILCNRLISCRSFRIDNYDESDMPKKSSWLTPGDMVFIITSIVVNANVQVKSFRVGGEEGRFGRLSTERLLPQSSNRGEEIRARLSSWGALQSLAFDFNLSTDQYVWAFSILESAPGIRQLSLRLDLTDNSTFFPRLVTLAPFHAIESLSLDCVTLNGADLTRFLLHHCSTLQSLTLRYVHLERKGDGEISWEDVFGRMKGQMHNLEQISLLFLFELYDGEERAHVVYPSLAADDTYPVIPGSEEGRGRVRADERAVMTLNSPIQLRYKYYGGQKRPYGVAYKGKMADQFLDLLRSSKGIYTY